MECVIMANKAAGTITGRIDDETGQLHTNPGDVNPKYVRAFEVAVALVAAGADVTSESLSPLMPKVAARRPAKRGMQRATRKWHKRVFEFVQKRYKIAEREELDYTVTQAELVDLILQEFERPMTTRTLRTILKEGADGLLN